MRPNRVTLPNTEVRYLYSSSNDQEYKLSFALPYEYTHSERSCPVLYVLDEPWLFAMYVQIVRAMQLSRKELPELIMAGIGYPTEAAGDLWALRMRDYTPTVDKGFVASFSENYDLPLTPLPKGSGGAAEFLSFLERDCLPWIEAEYGGETGRRLITGWSFGGLFCLYTLFHRPELFSDYLALSPSLWWDEEVTFNYEEIYAQAHTSLSVRLFLSVGSGEGGSMVTNVEKLKAILAQRAYNRLLTKTTVLEAETHLSVVAGSFSKGIRWTLSGAFESSD